MTYYNIYKHKNITQVKEIKIDFIANTLHASNGFLALLLESEIDKLLCADEG